MRIATILALPFFVTAAACGTSGGALPAAEGIRVLSPAPAPDTVGARLAQLLIVEVRDDAGALRPGIIVHFEAQEVQVGGVRRPTLLMAPPASSAFHHLVAATTDGAGRAAVQVQLGTVPGAVPLAISAGTLGYTAEVRYTVQPGAPVALRVEPADTAVRVGASYTPRAGLRDRFDNVVRTLSPSYAAGSGAAAASGQTVTGVTPGSTTFTATAADFSTTFTARVVPQGTLIATAADGVYTLDLDGTGYRRLIAHTEARSARWLPDGQSFVYSVGLGPAYVGSLDGSRRRLIPQDSPFAAELWAHPSRDGAWVYFGGYSRSEFRGHPYRVRPDGSELQLVPGYTPSSFTNEGHPSPAPDGERIVFFREVGSPSYVVLRVLDMATGQYIADDVPGHAPAWSRGETIAYVDTRGRTSGPLKLMNSEGTNQRVLSPAEYHFGIDWSPDDRWIVARSAAEGRLEVVEAATGLRIPLPFTTRLYDPSWRP